MKNHFSFIFFVLSTLIFTACLKEDLKTHDKLLIEFGSACGWCAGEETITISESKIEYIRNIPCGENEGQTKLSRTYNSEEWEGLINSLNYDYFLTLDYNTCNVCVDGCDEFIFITKDGETHEIRYTPGNEIEGIESFQEKLYELLAGFTESD